MKLNTRAALLSLGGATLFTASFVVGYSGALPRPRLHVTWTRPSQSSAPVQGAASVDAQIVLIYIGSSTCGPSNDPELPAAWRRIEERIRNQTAAVRRSLVTVGIARDFDAEAGLRHLRRYGPFDELVSGQGWSNVGLVHYVWKDVPGPAATPQILVVERNFEREAGVVNRGTYTDKLLMRKVGTVEIKAFARLEAPLPRLKG